MPRPDPYWHGRTVLVTGSSGFVGSHLAEALGRSGAEVVGLSLSAAAQAGTTTTVGDVGDPRLLRRVLEDHRPQTVFHLAARAIVDESRPDPAATFEVNVRGTWNLLDACRSASPEIGIVLASSEPAGGVDDPDPSRRLTHPYFVSKRCAELVAGSFHGSCGSAVAVARFANLFGAGDPNTSRIVPGTILTVLRGERPLIRSDGSPLRDYLHVADAVDGLLRLARALEEPGVRGGTFALRSGAPRSVLEITRTILALMGREDLQPRVLGQRPPELAGAGALPAGAPPVPGWQPGAPLERRLAETIDGYRRRHDTRGGES